MTDGQPTPLARLLGMGLRLLIDDLHDELAARGWTDVRESYGFVLLAVRDQPTTTGELAGLLGVSKQAASKLLDAMDTGGYIARQPSIDDGRVKVVTLTDRGRRLLDAVEDIYRRLEEGWAAQIGHDSVEHIRGDLECVLRSRHGGELPAMRPVR